MEEWKKEIDALQAFGSDNNDILFNLLDYQYGYVAWCIGNERKTEAKIYLELAKKNIVKLEKLNYKSAYVHAYKAALLGFEIGLWPYKAPFLGPQSVDQVECALKLDAENWLALQQYGHIQFYMPPLFGGSKIEAINYYTRSLKNMELLPNLKNNWNYLNLLVALAQAHAKIKNYVEAKMYYEKIIKIEPRFNWVKNELYPQLLREIENSK